MKHYYTRGVIIINKKILSDVGWQQAYVEAFNNPDVFYAFNGSNDLSEFNRMKPSFNFSLRDIDNNGAPELIIFWGEYGTAAAYSIYTYSNEIKDLGNGLNMRTGGLFISDNLEYPGLFTYTSSYNGDEDFEYRTIKNNELVSEVIWRTRAERSSDGFVDYDVTPKVIINNKPLIAELRKEIPIPDYPITDTNIKNIIYNYDKSRPTNPHPYAIALEDYLKDLRTNATAYLEDINGDGTMEMLVSEDGLYCERLFYMYNGKVYTYDIDLDDYAGMYFSTNKHLILSYKSGDGGRDDILTIKNGKVTQVTNLSSQLGAYPGDTTYFQDDKMISESAYDKLLEKYGISLADSKKLFIINSNNRVEYSRKSQIEEILAMTATENMAPVISTVNALPTDSTVLVDKGQIQFEAYTINDNNYFKLRDLAQVVNKTTKNFEVSWDGANNAINLVSKNFYTSVGGELNKGDGKPKSATLSTSTIYKDGNEISLTAYTINGNNYFKLRDVAKAFDIGITWDEKTKTIGIDTTTSYVAD